MIKTITKNDYPDLWNLIVDDYYEMVEKEHRRGSTFYTQLIYEINEEFFPNNPELHGFWMSETIIWCDDYGFDSTPDTLQRVEKKKKMIEVEQWETV